MKWQKKRKKEEKLNNIEHLYKIQYLPVPRPEFASRRASKSILLIAC
jgi:hypothetical protein